MSEYYRLMSYYNETLVDVITSGIFYLVQALGILLFMYCLKRYTHIINQKKTFVLLLIIGVIPMLISLLSDNAYLITFFSIIFNLFIGLYFGYYLSYLAKYVSKEKAGLCFGIAYAIGSVGTYLLSLINDGNFLISKEVNVVYLILVALLITQVLTINNLDYENNNYDITDVKYFKYLIIIIILVSIISVIGSNLYYSLPSSDNINWYFIRAFYAFGLIIAGYIIDRNRLIGEICVIASLTYPLISSSLLSEGLTNTFVLALSYFFRGFITIYYIITFTDLYHENKSFLILSSIGLMISRLIEAILTLVLMYIKIPNIIQLLVSASLFIPLLITFNMMQNIKYHNNPISEDKRLALFSEKYNLTNREMEIVSSLKEGLSDNEIADKYFISKNTVRFHISNILKKTASNTRVEIIRNLNKFD